VVFRRTNELQACNAALVGYMPQRLPTDPIGTFSLTLTNIAPGSAVQVETAGGTSLHNGTSAGAEYGVLLDAYAPGSPLNSLRIKVRKGSSSPFFQPWETLATATPGSASIYVTQIPDE
jgi:hypothetical protein